MWPHLSNPEITVVDKGANGVLLTERHYMYSLLPLLKCVQMNRKMVY